MTEIKSLKGFYDRYPNEFAAWRKLINTVDETAREFGFREINTPNVEKTELYRVKSGDELLDQTYSFKDKGDREITLIPEQTPTRARLVQQRKDLKTPIKWYDTSKRWRYEDVQKGRDREFFQGDFDIFGIESVEADAEIIACAATIYKKLDVEERVEFLVNDRKLLESILESKKIEEKEKVMQVIDDKEKMTQEEFIQELTEKTSLDKDKARLVDEVTSINGPIKEKVEELEEMELPGAETSIQRMRELAEALEAYNVAEMCKIDLSIVRGLAYYTGLVFEAFDSEGELRALFGGGRYDDLVGLFGDREVPAVGFAFGYSTTRELMKKEGKWPEEQVETDVYILTVSEGVRKIGLEYAEKLRNKGLVVETDLAGRGFGSQLSYADSINAKRVLIIGQRDLKEDKVTMKHMDSGKEEELDKDEVISHLDQEGLI